MSRFLTSKTIFWLAIVSNLANIGIVIYELISGAGIAFMFLIFLNNALFIDILFQLLIFGAISFILLILVLIVGRSQKKYSKNISLGSAVFGFIVFFYLLNKIWIG